MPEIQVKNIELGNLKKRKKSMMKKRESIAESYMNI